MIDYMTEDAARERAAKMQGWERVEVKRAGDAAAALLAMDGRGEYYIETEGGVLRTDGYIR